MPDFDDLVSMKSLAGRWRRVVALLVLGVLVGAGVTAAEASGERPADAGALDLDVRPERAEVFVDGQFVGIADAYDGFPRYLWLEPGEYRVVLYLPGYRTVAREFTLGNGQVIRVKTRLEKGETVPPETLFEKPTVRAEARLQADRERERFAQEPSWDAPSEPPPYGGTDLPADAARLFLQVHPEDAAVYLDGRFLGTGRDLASLHSGLLLDAGSHVVEVVRPGFDTRTVRLDVSAGEDERLQIELDAVEGRAPGESPPGGG